MRKTLNKLRHWALRRLAGRSCVMVNADIRGMAVVRGSNGLVADSYFDTSANLYDGDHYEWFTPSRPQPYCVKIEAATTATTMHDSGFRL